MYTLTEIFFTLTVALMLGVSSFIMAATVVLVKAGFDLSIRIARRIRVQVAALAWDRQADSLVTRMGSRIS